MLRIEPDTETHRGLFGLRHRDQQYLDASAAALFACDYLTTFGDELAFVWRRPKGMGTVLYLLARYPAFVDLSLRLYRIAIPMHGILQGCGIFVHGRHLYCRSDNVNTSMGIVGKNPIHHNCLEFIRDRHYCCRGRISQKIFSIYPYTGHHATYGGMLPYRVLQYIYCLHRSDGF